MDGPSELAVSGFGAVLALVVVFGYIQRDSGGGRAEEDTAEGKAGDVFEQVGVLDGFRRGLAPDEGAVSGDQNAWNGGGVEALRAEAADDDGACRVLIGRDDLLRGEGFGDGNGAVEVVGVGGAEAWHRRTRV